MSRKFSNLNRPGLGFSESRDRSRSPLKAVEKNLEKTIMVQNVRTNTSSRDLEAFFSSVGKVINIKWLSKNSVFVEFEKQEYVAAAIKLTGRQLMGNRIDISVQSTKKPTMNSRTESFPLPTEKPTPFGRLYIGNLHFKVTMIQLKELFEPFGKLEFIKLVEDESGRSRGFAFAKFFNPEHANAALQALNGVPVQGLNIKVTNQDGSVNSQNFDLIIRENQNMAEKYKAELKGNKSQPKNVTSANLPNRADAKKFNTVNRNNFNNNQTFGIDRPGSNKVNANNEAGYLQKQSYSQSRNDQPEFQKNNDNTQNAYDNLNSNYNLSKTYENQTWTAPQNNNHMYQSNYSGGAQSNSESYYLENAKAATSSQKSANEIKNSTDRGESTKPSTIFPGTPSQCLMATNMFDPNDQNGNDWAAELCDDVIEEVAKYGGALVHIFVDQTAIEGNVYLKASNLEGAWCIVRALHGRYFDGRQVKVESVPLALYHKLFPKSANAAEPIPVPSSENFDQPKPQSQVKQPEPLLQYTDIAQPLNTNNPPQLINFQMPAQMPIQGSGLLQQQIATWNPAGPTIYPQNLNLGFNALTIPNFHPPVHNLTFQHSMQGSSIFGQNLQFSRNF